MKLNYLRIVSIIIISSVIGLSFNYFSLNGIPLIRETPKEIWAEEIILAPPSPDEPLQEIENQPSQSKLQEQKQELIEQKKNFEPSVNTTPAVTQAKKEIPPFTEPKKISLTQAFSLFNNKIAFIDAREKEDFLNGHITGAINIPYYDFEPNEFKLNSLNKDTPIITYCGGTDCDLSIMLGNKLFKMGYKYVYIFFGGWNEWTEAGYSVSKGDQ
jgi:rhodanese-related sulfurtransferase